MDIKRFGRVVGAIIIILLFFFVALALLFKDSGPDLNSQLIEAARTGNSAEVRSLLESGADANAIEITLSDERDSANGQSLLHFAVSNPENVQGRLETVRLLLRSGADVNAGAVNGETPLHLLKSLRVNDSKAIVMLLKSKHAIDKAPYLRVIWHH